MRPGPGVRKKPRWRSYSAAMTTSSRAPAFARRGLVILTAINLLNYLDRYIVPPLLESIKRSELHPSDTQLFSLTSAFLIVYTLSAPFFGTLGDRRSRPRLLAAGVALWSVATALAGFARSYGGLFAARAAVGVGEAAYGTIAPGLLADYFPRSLRGRVFAIFFVAIPVGSALGYVLGGLVDHHWGWRNAFFVAGVPGILLALLLLRLHEPPRGASEELPVPTLPPTRASYVALFRNRAYLFTVAGYAAYTFALGGIAAVMPSFLQRVRGLAEVQATVTFGAVVVGTGLVGTFTGGWLGDRLLARTPHAYLWLSGVATLVAAPLIVVALVARVPALYWSAIVLAELLMFASTGPINSNIVGVVGPEIRATAMAVSIFAIHLLGDVPSPAIVGTISDRAGLGAAVLILPVAALVGAVVWMYGAWRG
jgi:MFS transporter, Spinster family, sphingosine-1-phosphate transporter